MSGNERARRGALYAPGPLPGINQVWAESATGVQVRLLGRKANRWVVQVLGGDPENAASYIEIGLDEHATTYTYVRTDCDHDTWCCREHSTHASPHHGCVLR